MFFFLNITTDHKEYCDYFYMTVHNVKNLQIIKLYKIYNFYPFWARAARQNRGFLAFGAQGAPKFSIWQREPKPKMPMSGITSRWTGISSRWTGISSRRTGMLSLGPVGGQSQPTPHHILMRGIMWRRVLFSHN